MKNVDRNVQVFSGIYLLTLIVSRIIQGRESFLFLVSFLLRRKDSPKKIKKHVHEGSTIDLYNKPLVAVLKKQKIQINEKTEKR